MLSNALQRASFRGVPVLVESIERNFGRRIAVHEFAGSDVPAFDDLGGKAATIQVRCSYSGKNWLQERDRLLAALENAGTAEWVDPTFGALPVRVESWALSEEMNPLGKASFALSFIVETPRKMDVKERASEPLSPQVQMAIASAELRGWEPKGDAFLDALLQAESIFSGIEEMLAGLESGMRFATSAVGKLQSIAFATRKAKARLRDVLAFPEAITAQWAAVSGLIRDAMRAPVVEKDGKKSEIDVAGVLGSVIASSVTNRETYTATRFGGLSAAENEARFLRTRKKIEASALTRREADFWREALAISAKIRARETPMLVSQEDRERVRGNREAIAAAWESFVLAELVRILGGIFTRSEERSSVAFLALGLVEDALARLPSESENPEDLEARFLFLSSLRSKLQDGGRPTESLERQAVGRGEPLLALCYENVGNLAFLDEMAERNAISDHLAVMGNIEVYIDEH